MHCYFGASPRALTRLMQHFGYLPVVFDAAGINIFFVHNEEVGGLRKPSRPSKVPGDTIDDDFNLENTIRSLEKAIALLGTSSIFGFMLGRTLHAPCHLHTWYKASPGINYSNIEWMRELELVVLSMGENDVGRVFREERIITGAMTGASNEECPVRFSQP